MTRPGGFGPRLVRAMAALGPVCPGIDPHPHLLRAWRLPESAEGAREFGYRLVDAVAGLVAVVKPQVSFFERYGAAGFAALEAVQARAAQAGLLTIADAKRGDIGSSAEGYADAWLDPRSPLCADAVTVSPYLGFGSVLPVVRRAADTGRGVFVLALTSNPEGRASQGARTASGETVAAVVAREAAAENAAVLAAAAADRGPGSPDTLPDAVDAAVGPVGLVVGVTPDMHPELHGLDLGALGGCVLAPGYGTQGGGASDLRRVVGGVGARVAVVVGRDLLSAGPDRVALRDRLQRHITDTRAALHP